MISHEINALIFIFDVVIFMLRKLIVISVVLNLQRIEFVLQDLKRELSTLS